MIKVQAISLKAAFENYLTNHKSCKFTIRECSAGKIRFSIKGTSTNAGVYLHKDTMNCGLLHASGIFIQGNQESWNFIFGYIDTLSRQIRKWGILYNTSTYQSQLRKQLIKHKYKEISTQFLNYNSHSKITFYLKQIIQ